MWWQPDPKPGSGAATAGHDHHGAQGRERRARAQGETDLSQAPRSVFRSPRHRPPTLDHLRRGDESVSPRPRHRSPVAQGGMLRRRSPSWGSPRRRTPAARTFQPRSPPTPHGRSTSPRPRLSADHHRRYRSPLRRRRRSWSRSPPHQGGRGRSPRREWGRSRPQRRGGSRSPSRSRPRSSSRERHRPPPRRLASRSPSLPRRRASKGTPTSALHAHERSPHRPRPLEPREMLQADAPARGARVPRCTNPVSPRRKPKQRTPPTRRHPYPARDASRPGSQSPPPVRHAVAKPGRTNLGLFLPINLGAGSRKEVPSWALQPDSASDDDDGDDDGGDDDDEEEEEEEDDLFAITKAAAARTSDFLGAAAAHESDAESASPPVVVASSKPMALKEYPHNFTGLFQVLRGRLDRVTFAVMENSHTGRAKASVCLDGTHLFVRQGAASSAAFQEAFWQCIKHVWKCEPDARRRRPPVPSVESQYLQALKALGAKATVTHFRPRLPKNTSRWWGCAIRAEGGQLKTPVTVRAMDVSMKWSIRRAQFITAKRLGSAGGQSGGAPKPAEASPARAWRETRGSGGRAPDLRPQPSLTQGPKQEPALLPRVKKAKTRESLAVATKDCNRRRSTALGVLKEAKSTTDEVLEGVKELLVLDRSGSTTDPARAGSSSSGEWSPESCASLSVPPPTLATERRTSVSAAKAWLKQHGYQLRYYASVSDVDPQLVAQFSSTIAMDWRCDSSGQPGCVVVASTAPNFVLVIQVKTQSPRAMIDVLQKHLRREQVGEVVGLMPVPGGAASTARTQAAHDSAVLVQHSIRAFGARAIPVASLHQEELLRQNLLRFSAGRGVDAWSRPGRFNEAQCLEAAIPPVQWLLHHREHGCAPPPPRVLVTPRPVDVAPLATWLTLAKLRVVYIHDWNPSSPVCQFAIGLLRSGGRRQPGRRASHPGLAVDWMCDSSHWVGCVSLTTCEWHAKSDAAVVVIRVTGWEVLHTQLAEMFGTIVPHVISYSRRAQRDAGSGTRNPGEHLSKVLHAKFVHGSGLPRVVGEPCGLPSIPPDEWTGSQPYAQSLQLMAAISPASMAMRYQASRGVVGSLPLARVFVARARNWLAERHFGLVYFASLAEATGRLIPSLGRVIAVDWLVGPANHAGCVVLATSKPGMSHNQVFVIRTTSFTGFCALLRRETPSGTVARVLGSSLTPSPVDEPPCRLLDKLATSLGAVPVEVSSLPRTDMLAATIYQNAWLQPPFVFNWAMDGSYAYPAAQQYVACSVAVQHLCHHLCLRAGSTPTPAAAPPIPATGGREDQLPDVDGAKTDSVAEPDGPDSLALCSAGPDRMPKPASVSGSPPTTLAAATAAVEALPEGPSVVVEAGSAASASHGSPVVEERVLSSVANSPGSPARGSPSANASTPPALAVATDSIEARRRLGPSAVATVAGLATQESGTCGRFDGVAPGRDLAVSDTAEAAASFGGRGLSAGLGSGEQEGLASNGVVSPIPTILAPVPDAGSSPCDRAFLPGELPLPVLASDQQPAGDRGRQRGGGSKAKDGAGSEVRPATRASAPHVARPGVIAPEPRSEGLSPPAPTPYARGAPGTPVPPVPLFQVPLPPTRRQLQPVARREPGRGARPASARRDVPGPVPSSPESTESPTSVVATPPARRAHRKRKRDVPSESDPALDAHAFWQGLRPLLPLEIHAKAAARALASVLARSGLSRDDSGSLSMMRAHLRIVQRLVGRLTQLSDAGPSDPTLAAADHGFLGREALCLANAARLVRQWAAREALKAGDWV